MSTHLSMPSEVACFPAEEMALDIRSHGLEGVFEHIVDGVLRSELHLELKNTCLYCNRT
jgi:hypothetical protein